MKRLVFIACASLVVLVFPLRAEAQHAHADSPKTTLTVTKSLVVGTTILQPGAYKFQCRTLDGRTFLVVTSVDTGKELARVPCVREALDAKVPDSDYRSLAREDGKRTLMSVRIKGEAVAHRVVD
jgi:hypothetical protein